MRPAYLNKLYESAQSPVQRVLSPRSAQKKTKGTHLFSACQRSCASESTDMLSSAA
jgi:hypothetical protein